MKNIHAYLNFNGNCKEAIYFYRDCLGGEVELCTYEESPAEMLIPADAKEKIMHARLSKGAALLMASDRVGSDPVKPGENVALSIEYSSESDMAAHFDALSQGGEVTMPLQDTFWGARFGMLKDKFGIHWMLHFQREAVCKE